MLAYAHLLEMLRRFTPEEAVRVATDSIYVRKTALDKLAGVEAFVGKKKCFDLDIEYLPPVGLAQWCNKRERIYAPTGHAAYQPKPEHWQNVKDISDSEAPSHADPLTWHALSYLNGGGSGKTT